jgi:integrase
MDSRFYLKRPEAFTDTSIFVRISYNGNRFKYYTPEKIKPDYWNFKTQQAKQTEKFKEYPEFNTRLNGIKSTIGNVFRRYINDKGKEPTVAIFKNLLDKEFEKTLESEEKERQLKTFWGFFNDFIQRAENGSRLHLQQHKPLAGGTIKNFKNVKRHLQDFEKWNRRKIEFDLIDIKFYNSLTSYLTEKELSINTIGKLITNLKVILREAWESGITSNTVFTHRKFKSLNVDTETIYLTENEIQELQSIDLSRNKRLDRVRDAFIIGCFTGLRYSDLAKLSPEKIRNDILEVVQTKTGNPVFIPVRTNVKELLNKYDNNFPSVISNQKFNEYLKEVCFLSTLLQKEITIIKFNRGKKQTIQKPKYEFVKSHTARRSFATNEYLVGDLQTFEIRAITGHKTEKAFYRYIRMTPRENAENVAKKWQERETKQNLYKTHLKAV